MQTTEKLWESISDILTLQTEVFEVVDPLHGHHLAHPEAVLQRAAVVVGEPTLMGWIQHLCSSSGLQNQLACVTLSN